MQNMNSMENNKDKLSSTLKIKPHINLTLLNCDLEWQLSLSYTYDKVIAAPPTLHTQDYYELIFHIKSGRAFYIDGTLLHAGYGDILVFPPDKPHKSVDITEKPYERYYLFVNPELLNYLPDGERIRSLWSDDRPNLIKPDDGTKTMILNGLSPLKSICNSRDEPCECDDQDTLMELRIHTMRIFSELIKYRPEAPQDETKLPPVLDGILNFIEKNFASIVSVKEIAEKFGISVSYMTRLFNSWLDTSPYKYIRSVRLIESKKLLKQGASVTEACFASGFGDCSHFIELFKSEVGMTPGEWATSSRETGQMLQLRKSGT